MLRSRLTLFALSLMLWSGLVFLAVSYKFAAIVGPIDLSRPIPIVVKEKEPPPPPKPEEIKPEPKPLIEPPIIFDSPQTTPIPVTPPYVAPPAPPAHMTGVTWLQRPGAREIDRYYPPRAADREKEGSVLLTCTVNANGTINCTVVSESPDGWGFGTAALQVSRYFKMAPQTVNGTPTSGGTIDVPLTFRLGR